ncbi:MAG: histidine phosphatase family protein [Pseudomonadota bacterium]|uniref:histidine phosphatase family protein n=1 Tax=Sphingomonas sp. ERG5 TaxID=1381597 RepID=UPI0009E0157B|nr:histidine phosphatase family protein [Sphingomonas sp. ERG5]
MAIAYYLSHPQVRVDPAVPVPDWGLSDAGRERLSALAGREWLATVRRIVSSGERKAIETAEILAPMTGAMVEVVAAMHENDRSATGFLPPDEFEATADQFFAQPGQSVRGWERAVDAQARIARAVRRSLSDRADDETILFVGHGGVGTLLKCAITGDPIDRRHDQVAAGGHPGGGNVHAFEADFSASRFGWTAMEVLA